MSEGGRQKGRKGLIKIIVGEQKCQRRGEGDMNYKTE